VFQGLRSSAADVDPHGAHPGLCQCQHLFIRDCYGQLGDTNEARAEPRRVHELAGWHTEIYIDAGELADLAAIIGALPKVSIDHLRLAKAGLPDLLRLAERGVWRSAYEDPLAKTIGRAARTVSDHRLSFANRDSLSCMTARCASATNRVAPGTASVNLAHNGLSNRHRGSGSARNGRGISGIWDLTPAFAPAAANARVIGMGTMSIHGSKRTRTFP
jgi:hypothetical protein